MILLSIGIPTIPEREDQFRVLYATLHKQIRESGFAGRVEIDVCRTKKRIYGGPNIATKRNHLLREAVGEFCVQIDDDDTISPSYIKRICTAIEVSTQDIAVIAHEITVREPRKPDTLALVSLGFTSWKHNIRGQRYQYTQSPYYKVPIRTSIAKQVFFNEHLAWGEDADQSKRLVPLLAPWDEILIREPLYTYNMPAGANPKTRY